jgi:hypothetical protein
MLLKGIDWGRPDRTWQPPMAVRTRLNTRSVTEAWHSARDDACAWRWERRLRAFAALCLRSRRSWGFFGLAAGVPAALFSTRSLSTLRLGVTPFDPLTFIGVAFLFTLGALAVGFFPARCATCVDPIRSLHYE